MCCCKARECENEDLYVTVLGRLVTIVAPLTNDTGNVLATVFFCRTSLRKADSTCTCNPQELALRAQ